MHKIKQYLEYCVLCILKLLAAVEFENLRNVSENIHSCLTNAGWLTFRRRVLNKQNILCIMTDIHPIVTMFCLQTLSTQQYSKLTL